MHSTFLMAKNLKISGCPSVDEYISKLGHIHIKGSRMCHPKICLFGIRIIVELIHFFLIFIYLFACFRS